MCIIAAALSPGGFDEDVAGDTANRAKMDQGARIRSIVVEDDASTSKMDGTPGTGAELMD